MRVLGVLPVLVVAAYPFLVYAGLRVLSPRALAGVLGALVLVRVTAGAGPGRRRVVAAVALPVAVVLAVLAVGAWLEDPRLFLFLPVLTNLALLVSFGRTLRGGPSLVEVLARLRCPHLPVEATRYCRRVTALWCAFFLLNAAVTLALARWASVETWTLYTGVVAYVLVGLLFAGEVIYRAWRFRRYTGGPTDVLLRRFFPPRTG